jgi:hypothetical protein
MHARQDRDRVASIDRDDEGCREVQTEVNLAAGDGRVLDGRGQLDITDVGEALCGQQLLGEVLRRNADARDLGEPDRGGLGRGFVGERCPGAQDARGAGR